MKMFYSLLLCVLCCVGTLAQQVDPFDNTQNFVEGDLATGDNSCIPYHVDNLKCSYEYLETFQESYEDKNGWIYSYQTMYSGQNWEHGYGYVKPTIECDKSMIAMDADQKYGIANKIGKTITNHNEDLVIQYEVRFQKHLTCSGGYLKFIKAGELENPEYLKEDSVYSILFGPDYCGQEHPQILLIIQKYNPVSKRWIEHKLSNAPKFPLDDKTHLYTLILKVDGSIEILIDDHSIYTGHIDSDFEPSFKPPKMIEDPKDVKPSNWVDQPFIVDPAAKKPEDWDETQPEYILDMNVNKPSTWLDDAPLMILDPSAKKPEDWDDELDGEYIPPLIHNPACEQYGCGEWERPKIKNPLYKGIWRAPKISNPEYKGVWKARMIPNPDYYVYEHPQKVEPFDMIAMELWTVDGGVSFDNIMITHDASCAKQLASRTFRIKYNLEHPKEIKEIKKKNQFKKRTQLTFNQFINKQIDELLEWEYDEVREYYVILILNILYCVLGLLCIIFSCKNIYTSLFTKPSIVKVSNSLDHSLSKKSD